MDIVLSVAMGMWTWWVAYSLISRLLEVYLWRIDGTIEFRYSSWQGSCAGVIDLNAIMTSGKFIFQLEYHLFGSCSLTATFTLNASSAIAASKSVFIRIPVVRSLMILARGLDLWTPLSNLRVYLIWFLNDLPITNWNTIQIHSKTVAKLAQSTHSSFSGTRYSLCLRREWIWFSSSREILIALLSFGHLFSIAYYSTDQDDLLTITYCFKSDHHMNIVHQERSDECDWHHEPQWPIF